MLLSFYMSDEKAIYWMTQIVGWFLFILLILFQNMLTRSVDIGILGFLVLNFFVGLGLSHLMRTVIVKFRMLKMKLYRVLPRILLLSVLTGVVATLIISVFESLIYKNIHVEFSLSPMVLIELIIPFTMVFLIWNVLYFATIYLKNYEREEIKNLRLAASVTEVELQNLRSQLNPHFMFNALNSIRALVDENPAQAKQSITQMSNILRSGLTSIKRMFVTLEEEMKVVSDYLDLEKIRFEERLNYHFSIPETLYKSLVPPLLVQTLVENAVKHGIGKLPNGGEIYISVKEIENEMLELQVINSGTFTHIPNPEEDHTGIGLLNSKRRLSLLYGDRASLDIATAENKVICTVVFPINTKILFQNENPYN